MTDFVYALGHYAPTINDADTLEFAAPRLHYASQDCNRQLTCCMDWRADIQLAVLEAHATDPDVTIGFVDFLVLQFGQQPAAEVLAEFPGAARFAELFDDEWLAPDVEEIGPFAAAVSIDVVLIITEVALDLLARGYNLDAWAVTEVIGTMLPTSAGLALMYPHQHDDTDQMSVATVEADDRLNRYWSRAGLQPFDGHPGFLGQATAFNHLDDARRDLSTVRDMTFRVPVARLRARLPGRGAQR